MSKAPDTTSKLQVIFELGPVTTIVLIQMLFVTLKLMNHIDWQWEFVFLPLWIILLIISGTAILGLLYWVTSNFIFRRKG
jgi:hypothetical protein